MVCYLLEHYHARRHPAGQGALEYLDKPLLWDRLLYRLQAEILHVAVVHAPAGRGLLLIRGRRSSIFHHISNAYYSPYIKKAPGWRELLLD